MSTQINVTVGSGGLSDKAKQLQAAARQAQLEKERTLDLSAEALDKRIAAQAAKGLSVDGKPLYSVPTQLPEIERRPAANRAGGDESYLFKPVSEPNLITTSDPVGGYYVVAYENEVAKGYPAYTTVQASGPGGVNTPPPVFYSSNGGPNNSSYLGLQEFPNGTNLGAFFRLYSSYKAWPWEVEGFGTNIKSLSQTSKFAKCKDFTLEFFVSIKSPVGWVDVMPRSDFFVGFATEGSPSIPKYGVTFGLFGDGTNTAGGNTSVIEYWARVQDPLYSPSPTLEWYVSKYGNGSPDDIYGSGLGRELYFDPSLVFNWNQWNHIAFVKKGDKLHVFLGGALLLTVAVSSQWLIYDKYLVDGSLKNIYTPLSVAGSSSRTNLPTAEIGLHGLNFVTKAKYSETGFTPPLNL